MVSADIMGTSPRSRTRQSNGSGKGLLGGARDLDSRRSTRTSPRTSLASPAKPLSPPASAWSDIEADPRSVQTDSPSALEDIAPEIVVWTEDMDTMIVDSPEPAVPPAEEEKITYDLIPFFCCLSTTPFFIPRHASTSYRCCLSLSLTPFSLPWRPAHLSWRHADRSSERPALSLRRRIHHHPQRCRTRYNLQLPQKSTPRYRHYHPYPTNSTSHPSRPPCRARLLPLSMSTAQEKPWRLKLLQ